ncbi:ROK family protein [Phaeacidiphilus oryzae]|uniref:ROK family protein n=1 Tax=Phaeacidiphilus oryzae TaxID=348818 RepID=UPI00068BF745|nr:ROK family protein [Phaeacidiphilus oryzae]
MPTPVVLALDFGGTKTALAVAEADGVRLGALTVETRAEEGAAASLSRAVEAARTLLADAAPGRELAAVGVATLGIPGENGVALAPNIPGWGGIALGRELRRAFPGARLALATDVKAAAQVEADTGALAGCDPGIYVNLGTGLAIALVVGGSVVAGRNGASGEIGYNLRRLADVGRRPGERVPLEEAVSGGALMLSAGRHLPPAAGPAELFAGAREHPGLARLLADFLDELAFHLVNLAIAVDPARIAVGGGMVRAWDLLHDRLRLALDAAVPYPPPLVPAAYPFDAPLLGALALARGLLRTRTPVSGSEPGGRS